MEVYTAGKRAQQAERAQHRERQACGDSQYMHSRQGMRIHVCSYVGGERGPGVGGGGKKVGGNHPKQCKAHLGVSKLLLQLANVLEGGCLVLLQLLGLFPLGGQRVLQSCLLLRMLLLAADC